MFNLRLIREEDALLQIEAFAWLIRTCGKPVKPAVPSPLHKSPQVNDLRLDEMDTRDVYSWAVDGFAQIKAACGMSDQDIGIVPIAYLHDRRGDEFGELTTKTLDHILNHAVYYDPSRCEEPNYFPATVLMQLAEMRSAGFRPAAGLNPLMQALLTLTCSCYSGQGFALEKLVPNLSAYLGHIPRLERMPPRLIENAVCFATCLNLRVHRQSQEQVIATYGSLMSPQVRKKMKQAYRQIDSFEAELKLLQRLSAPPKTATGRVEPILQINCA